MKKNIVKGLQNKLEI